MRRHDRDGSKPWQMGSQSSGRISTIAGGPRQAIESGQFEALRDVPSLATTGASDPAAAPQVPFDTLERLLRPAEAACILGVSVKQMANWRSKGGGPRFVRISHKVVMYRHQSLLEWAREREFGSAHEARLSKP